VNNRDKLIEMMVENELTRYELSEMLRVDIQELDHWLLPIGAAEHKNVPDMAIELLELKLKRQTSSSLPRS